MPGGYLARPLASLLERGGAGNPLGAGGGINQFWNTYTARSSTDTDVQYCVPFQDTSIDAQWHSTEASAATAFCAGINQGPRYVTGGGVFIYTAGAGLNSACLLRMAPVARPAIGKGIYHAWLKGVVNSTSCQLNISIVQNSGSNWTTRQTFNVSTSATTVFAEYLATLCASVQRVIEASAADGFRNLYVRFQKANNGNVQIENFYGAFPAANVRDMLIPDYTWHSASVSLDIGNPEISQDGKAISWYERKSNGSSFDGYVALCGMGGSLGPDDLGKGFFGGRSSTNLPQMGERAAGPYQIGIDPDGYFFTVDINYNDIARSSVHTWSTGDPDSQTERLKRKAPFAIKHTGINDHIVTYRYETGTGCCDLYAVNLDQGWNRVLLDHQATAPVGRGDALTYNTPRSMPNTFDFYGGKYMSAGPPSPPCQIVRFRFTDVAFSSVTIESVTSGTFHHGGVSVFKNAAGVKHITCNRTSTSGSVGTGIIVYKENATTSVFDIENKYNFASASDWMSEWIAPGIAQSVEATNPDRNGDQMLCWSVSDTSQALTAFTETCPSVIAGAYVGCASVVAVISRRTTWKTKFEPEPNIINGIGYCQYGESRNTPPATFLAVNQAGRMLRLPDRSTFMARYAAIQNAYAFSYTASNRYPIPAGALMVRIRTNSDVYVNFGTADVVADANNVYFQRGSEDWNLNSGWTYIALRGVQANDIPVITWDTTGYRTY